MAHAWGMPVWMFRRLMPQPEWIEWMAYWEFERWLAEEAKSDSGDS